ncbi:MAG: pyridoxal phosphate-dependent aminotransferase [Actinomycetota bacterium]|nr:pyridoxal phosphate-dependent aminotransferase [Actinomycetota bacterium]
MISERAQKIPPFIVMDILERAQAMQRKGENIIHLEIGEPDFDTPDCIKEAAYKALKEGKTGYTHSLGLPELREAISEHYYRKYNVEVAPDQIVITSGTSPAMFLIFSVLLNPGNEVILSNPCYACYPNFVEFLDGIPIYINVYEEDGFQYRAERIRGKINPKTKAIFINSPSNPTGNLLSLKVMEEIAEIAHKNCFVVSDEIYHGLVYEGREHSILEFTDEAFVLNGFSKTYAMTGWRLGYVIAPKEFIRPMQKIQQNFFISANNFVQWAGIAALKEAGADVKRIVKIYNQRRKYIIPKLREIGFGIKVEPTGAFYVLANAKHFGNDSYKLALEILENAKVAVTPGIDFGDNAEGYIRFSYANSLENITEGMNRLEKHLKGKNR